MRLVEGRGIEGIIARIAEAGALSGHALLEPAAAAPADLEAADAAFRAERWSEALAHYAALVRRPLLGVDYRDVLIRVGRCHLYLGDHAAGAALLEILSEVYFDSYEVLFYLGRCRQMLDLHDDALATLLQANLLQPRNFKCLMAIATTAHAHCMGGYGMTRPGPAGRRDLAINAYREAAAIKPKDQAPALGLARLLAETGEVGRAIAGLEAAARQGVAPRRLLGEAVRLGMRGGLYGDVARLLPTLEEARGDRLLLARARRVLELVDGRSAKARTTAPEPGSIVTVLLEDSALKGGFLRLLGQASLVVPAEASPASVEAQLRLHERARFVLIGSARGLARGRAAYEDVAPRLGPDVAGIAGGGPGVDRWVLWSLPRLLALMDELEHETPSFASLHDELATRARLLRVPMTEATPAAAMAVASVIARVALVSRNGAVKFGGGEHFLHEAERRYRAWGCATLFVSIDPRGQEATRSEVDGTKIWSLPDDPAALRRLLLAERIDLVHCLSGLGQTCLDAMVDLSIRVVYGIHFWREFLLSPACHDHYFPYADRSSRIDPAFRAILRRADHVYANSEFVAALCRRHLGLDPIQIPSLVADDFGRGEEDPADPDVSRAESLGRGFVLQINARADKGFELVLDIARHLPRTRFVVVASQSSLEVAKLRVTQRGLRNVVVLARFDNMAPLFRRARVVLVPSFQFVETFSRVVIEAQRAGTPVIGARAGNIPHLLERSGFLVEEDPAAWAECVERLVRDDVVHAEAVERAVANSRHFSSRRQADGLERLFRSLSFRILVAAGSGLGNVCHVLPLVRKVAEHFGRPVDVVLDADSPGCSVLFAGSPWVASVYEDAADVTARGYDLVLVTHCWGGVVPRFDAARVLASRDFVRFDPTEGRHEAMVNLDFLARALSIPIEPGDERRYSVGAQSWSLPAKRRVALHAGCKGGVYRVKRWPYFEELARGLAERGYEPVSVGGTVAEVVAELLACDLLVTNDSGIMNLGNALGMPVVALFGPSSARVRGPLRSPGAALQAPVPCSPCEESPTLKERFTKGQCGCIATLKLETVLARTLEVLDDLYRAAAPTAAERAVPLAETADLVLAAE